MKRLYLYFERDQPTFFTNIIRNRQYGDPDIHVGAVVEMEDINNPTVLEMYLKVRKTKYRDIDVHAKSKISYYYIEVPDYQYNRFFEFLNSMIGKEFDFGSLLSFSLNLSDRDLNKIYCSELIAMGLEQAGIKMFSSRVKKWQILPLHIKWSPLLIEDIETNLRLDNSKNKWSLWDKIKLWYK